MKHQIQRSIVALSVGTNGGFLATFCFNRDLPVFAGHFPGAPIVPGVFLIESVRVAAERSCRASLRIAAVVDAKFLAPVLPDAEIVLAGTIVPDGDALRCDSVARLDGVIVAKLLLRLCYPRNVEQSG